MSNPLVLVVGKPNVGKSTLFNRIIKEKKSIVLDYPGVTRDHVYAEARWDERAFMLVDTCGIFEDPEEIIAKQQKEVVLNSIREAALVIFVVDGKNGLTSEDHHIAEFIRKAGVDVVLAANKAEGFEKYESFIKPDLYQLGFGEPIPVSAEHNRNIDELLDEVVEKLENKGISIRYVKEIEEDENTIKVAFIGKPNAGKSSLFNAITGMKKAIVSDIPGTTRDTVDQIVTIDENTFKFIDTAGMRKKSTVKYGTIEMYSIIRTIKTIEKSDVVVLLIDATEGVTQQDKKVAGLAENNGKGTIIVFNKWDLIEQEKREEFINKAKKELYFINYSPVIFTEAKNSKGIKEVIKKIVQVNESRNREISTSILNQALERHMMMTPPPIKKGKRVKLYYGVQVGVRPPVFTFYANMPKELSKSYQQSIRNMIRKYIDPFEGSPLFLKFEERKR
ncbi:MULTISPECIES: ribosome biogenesis GTPase Der [Oceanotoga]|uniref:GTPase Der n=1 Tax=Oceanotoga teriensis TaxID=515440 RepID=A0AA45HI10_9BACT|nr:MULTISPECIES: ribosome biogenesis GTPase Der [Oceanotoga]MDN5341682.1 GTPase [Oceanotoga sp.]MDO7977436.1 ribosome biogenesis GTPase Der [Oceanotoga teriensis]PWJ89612.1 GTP-binding protein [Oceanotoga teriensis]